MHSYSYIYQPNQTNAFIHMPSKLNQCIHKYTNQTKPINIPFNLPKYVINQSFDMKGLK